MNRDTAARLAASVFFAALLLVGLLCSGNYGLPCDEPAEQIILQENLHEYSARLLGEGSAPAQWYQSRGIQRISQSIERDHGQCAYYPAAPLLTLPGLDANQRMRLWHAYTWLLFMLGVGALYGLCRQLGLGRVCSCAGMLLLYLCPRFFAEGHYNNKDMVLLSLTLCTLWAGARFLRKPGFARGALLSLAGAMAANTKVVGAFAWGLMGLCAVILVTADRRWSLRMAGVAAATIALFGTFYALLTPAMWADPLGYLQYLVQNASGFTRWTGVVVFRGNVIDQAVTPLPRYYLPWMMVVTLPLYILPLAAAGQLAALRRAARQRARLLRDPATLTLAAASLMWFVPLAYAALARPLVYNGWRHFYFVYAGIAPLAAYGASALYRLAKRISGDYGMHRVFAAGLALFLGWTAYDIQRCHPHEYAYYNRLGHATAETGMELDYWNLSVLNAMERLLVCERNEQLPLVLGARDDMSWLGVFNGHKVMRPEDSARLTVLEDGNAPYLLSNATYALIYGVAPPEGYRELFHLESYGLRICTVYEQLR